MLLAYTYIRICQYMSLSTSIYVRICQYMSLSTWYFLRNQRRGDRSGDRSISDTTSLNQFFHEGENPVKRASDFSREELPSPWDEVCYIIMKYFTLEGRYGFFYYYHLPFLNHLKNKDLISIPFFLLRSLDYNVKDIAEAKKKGKEFPILHQGLILRLYNFHLALCPSRMISVQNVLGNQPLAITTDKPDISPPPLLEIGSCSKKNKKHHSKDAKTPKKVRIQEIDSDVEITDETNTPRRSVRLTSEPPEKSLRDPSSIHEIGNSIPSDNVAPFQSTSTPHSASSTHASESPKNSMSPKAGSKS
ncbi:uncharacterized protein LOC131035524 isoform X1 [Cryptomeria japonica]|uniref:uncharacterized protein LOC131035524 isoform X1 n=1 Tax=Cryptomeria japonica TaxID=3369 RepID=UPI0027D9F488|nr:uncharacterized protein LOC131035524 isoform X1 [Cryptomeria japonica]